MATDSAGRVPDLCPLGVVSKSHKDARGALVCSQSQHNVVTFMKFTKFGDHLRLPYRAPFAAGYGRNRSLFATLAFSSLAFAASCSPAARAASL
jgi:hypothetical protein